LSGENNTPELRFGDCDASDSLPVFPSDIGFFLPSFAECGCLLANTHHQLAVTHLLYVTQEVSANVSFFYSNGHGCMLQYAILHLFGYDLSIDDLKAFRVS
jgi:hypothetical protein